MTIKQGLLIAALWLAGSIVAKAQPQLAIIIDDLGYGIGPAKRVTALEAPVALAILPGTPKAVAIAHLAHAANKEVLLHLPMQSMGEDPKQPGTLNIDTTRAALINEVRRQVANLPHVAGLNTHQGSLLTQHPGHMRWLMEYLSSTSLYFIDSYTTHHSVALDEAAAFGIPAARRHVFLDNVQEQQQIEAELDRAIQLARHQGFAIAIGHPYPETLAILERRLPNLAVEGVSLVHPSALTGRDGSAQVLAP